MRQGAPTIMLVDDDESFCTALERLLRLAGHNVQTFTSPERFLARLPGDGSGCVVLNLHTPGINGLEVQKALSQLGRTWPIVFVSGRGDVRMSVRAMKAGAVDILTKPVD